MDTPTLLKPRLRLSRRNPSQDDATPQPPPRAVFHDDNGDDDDSEYPTPRVYPKHIPDTTPLSLPPLPAETPAARLRALLAREPRSQRATTPPSDADSAAEPPRFGSSTSSVARDSLRDIFSRALREPGDTPEKGRLRRNSFDGSSMEITPVVDRDRGQRRKAARRSLSDEEAEKPKSDRRADPSFRLSTAFPFDALRARLVSSRSQLVDQNPPDALYDHSLPASASTSNSRYQPPASTSTSEHLQASSLTPHPSFHMSSQMAFQSNLLEQDSEMQRAMGNVVNSESEASTSAPEVAQPPAIPSSSRPSSSLRRNKNSSTPESRRSSYELHSSTSSVNGATAHHSQKEEREREWNRPRLSSTPDINRRHSHDYHRLSQEFRSPSHTKSFSHGSVVPQGSAVKPAHRQLERRGSIASLRSFDDEYSSQPSSIGSQADYRDRISELERDRNHERERDWNKRHPPSRTSSSLSTSSNHSFSHSHSHLPRSPSETPYLAPTHASLQRRSSIASLRSDSPASVASSRDSLKEQEEEVKNEIVQERERNWNSPRPHWSTSKTPSPAHLKFRQKDNNSLRASSSLPHLRGSNGHGDASRTSPRVQSALAKHVESVPSPAIQPKSGDRSDSGLEKGAVGISPSAQKAPGAAAKFGWNFARSPLPPLELDDSTGHRRNASSPISAPRPSGTPEAITAGQIPIGSRMKSFTSISHVASDMSFTNIVGDESSFQREHDNKQGDTMQVDIRREAQSVWSQEDAVPGSDEESVADIPQESTTPKSRPPIPIPEEIETDAETEPLTTPSPQGSPQLGASDSIPNEPSYQKVDDPPRSQSHSPSLEDPVAGATPPGTPPSTTPEPQVPASPSFFILTPPRQTSFGSSILDFRTPSPPHDLPDLPGPPLSSDDDALGGTPIKDRRADGTFTKTPKPPGAWAATPVPPKFGPRPSSPTDIFPLDSTPPASTSTPLPRATSLPPTCTDSATDNSGEDELLTPVVTLSRARSLPLRTPAPPGAWVATPGQSTLLGNGADQSQFGSIGRRKGLLKVRFDVTESETSATEGRPSSPISAIRLSNPQLPLPLPNLYATAHGTDDSTEAVASPSTLPATVPRPATPERPTTPTSRENGPSPRSLRKSPSVRLVDAYGRERVDEERTTGVLPNGHADPDRKRAPSPSPSRRSLLRIVDAMGREVDDTVEIPGTSESRAKKLFEAELSAASDDAPIGHAEALARMRKTLRHLAESLSDTERSEDLDLNSSHLEQLEEVSRAARLARNQLAHNLRLETAKEQDLPRGGKSPALLLVSTKKPWSTTVICCGVIIQLLLFVVMWRYAHAEAHRLFYTTYYDPLYPEFTPMQGNSCFSGTLSTSRSWTMLDSYETIRREGWWAIQKEILRAMRHAGDRAWELWGESVYLEKPT